MPQPDHVCAYPIPDPTTLDEDLQAVFAKCIDKLGLVPNVLAALLGCLLLICGIRFYCK